VELTASLVIIIVVARFLQPQQAKSRQPAYSQALNQNKVDKQWVKIQRARQAGRQICWRAVFSVWRERSVERKQEMRSWWGLGNFCGADAQCTKHCLEGIIYKGLFTRHCLEGIIYKGLFTRHCLEGIIYKALFRKHYLHDIFYNAFFTRHYLQGTFYKALFTRHCLQGIVYKALYTRHCSQGIISKTLK